MADADGVLVEPGSVVSTLAGRYRPGHLGGVATVA